MDIQNFGFPCERTMYRYRQLIIQEHIKVEDIVGDNFSSCVRRLQNYRKQDFCHMAITALLKPRRQQSTKKFQIIVVTRLDKILLEPRKVDQKLWLFTSLECSIKKSYSIQIQLWEVELLFLVYYVSNYILKYFATSNADDKFQQIISSWRLFMNYSLTQEGQKYDFDRIRPQSTIQSRYLIFQKGKIEITTCNKRTAMTKINAVEDVQGRSTNSLNKLRQF
ncbi:Hypothetical_protein [Hexamita inflata]|uniref:Hypothetical_protein n=1 Tax=Hexamita inflata TaxID=28002 RepID=A0ABP1JAN3_9EUKA